MSASRRTATTSARLSRRVFLLAATAAALLWMAMTLAVNDAAAAQRGTGSFEGGGFGRVGSPMRFYGPRGGGPGYGGDLRRPRLDRIQGARDVRSRHHRRLSRGNAGAGHVRSQSAGHHRRASAGGTRPGHVRGGSMSHRRGVSGGRKHSRRMSAGSEGAHKRAGSAGHRRRASAADSHSRHASSGTGHNRRISAGSGDSHRRRVSAAHDRRRSGPGGHARGGSFAAVPPVPRPAPPRPTFAPPVAPAAGAAGQPPRGTPPVSPPPPQRAARMFGGAPPAGEDRYLPDEVICVLRDDLTEPDIDRFLAEQRMERIADGRIQMGLIGVELLRYRIADGRPVAQAVAELQTDQRVVSVQPNYVYQLAQPAPLSAAAAARGEAALQYVVAKLRLREAHAITRGERVLVAVIDSGVDTAHPELAGSVVKEIDVTQSGDHAPHGHGTAMASAIASQSQLVGVAPAARVIAIRAFAPRSRASASGTSFHVALAIDHAAREGARIVNLSLSGPQDPYIRRTVEGARARGIVLVAAAGNGGPSSAPLYPAAYLDVIAVTAADAADRLFEKANRGSHISVAAPGVDVLVAQPRGAYGVSTGTSVAAAHVSGVIALMLARNPALDPVAAKDLLTRSVRPASRHNAAAEGFGAGHVDAYAALVAAGRAAPGPPIAASAASVKPASVLPAQ